MAEPFIITVEFDDKPCTYVVNQLDNAYEVIGKKREIQIHHKGYLCKGRMSHENVVILFKAICKALGKDSNWPY